MQKVLVKSVAKDLGQFSVSTLGWKPWMKRHMHWRRMRHGIWYLCPRDVNSLVVNGRSRRNWVHMAMLRSTGNGWSRRDIPKWRELIVGRYSPITKMTSIRLLLSLVATHDLEVEQMDVKTTFLHGDLEEEIYMSQLDHFVEKGKENLVCKLKKSLYGLKQSPRIWYRKFNTYVLSLGFERSKSDHCVYYKYENGHIFIIVLYVDDTLFIGNGKRMISNLKS